MIKIIYKVFSSVLVLFLISSCFFGGRQAGNRTGYNTDLNSTYGDSGASGSGILTGGKKGDGGGGGTNVLDCSEDIVIGVATAIDAVDMSADSTPFDSTDSAPFNSFDSTFDSTSSITASF